MDDQARAQRPAKGRKRDAERTRKAILQAALREFSQQGYSGARIDKIAARAKCNIRMLYHYFGGKKDLYVAALEGAYDDIRSREAQLQLDLERPLEGLLELFRFTYEYFEKNPHFEGLLRTENMMQGKFVRRSAHVTEAGFPLRKTIAQLIESGQSKGELREGLDPVQIYVTMTALSRFHLANAFSLGALLETDMTRAEWRRARWSHSVELLTAYLTTPPDGHAATATR
jgi:AcrR family transcriptional regulator